MKKGFTLIELLVVVLIIGILSAVALPQYKMAVYKARMTRIFTWGNHALQEAELFYLSNGRYPTSFLEMDVQVPGCTHTENYYSKCDDNPDVVSVEVSNGGIYFNMRRRLLPAWAHYYLVFSKDRYSSYKNKKFCVPNKPAEDEHETSILLCKTLSGKEPVNIWSGQAYPLD